MKLKKTGYLKNSQPSALDPLAIGSARFARFLTAGATVIEERFGPGTAPLTSNKC